MSACCPSIFSRPTRTRRPGFIARLLAGEIDVQVSQGVLAIRADHQQKDASENKRFHRKERSRRSMTRRIGTHVRVVHVSADMSTAS